jgi:hypothetical protein
MKARMGMMMVDVSGKLGGQVATKGRNGLNIRTKVKPINRRTNSQVNQRSSLASQSQVWRSLTDAQRAAWTAQAAQFTFHNNFGQKYHPSGKNYFTRINENLLFAGAAAITTPGLTTPATAQTSFTATSTGANLVGDTFAASPVPAGMAMLVFATRGLSAGVGFVGKQYRFIQKVAAAGTTPTDLTTTYTAKFGAPISGSRVFLQAKMVNITTGQESIPLQASVIIT